MNLSRRRIKGRKKAVAAFLSVALAANTCAMIRISALGEPPADAKTVGGNIVERSGAYLNTKVNADKSIGDDRLVNDTTDALIAFRKAGMAAPEGTTDWLAGKDAPGNTDITARIAAGEASRERLAELSGRQNKDGGFGLYPDYSSDVLDSVIALQAVNETGGAGDISGQALCNFLIGAVNEDGGYSYTEGGASDPELSAMVVYNIEKFTSASNNGAGFSEELLSYVSDNIPDNYGDNGIAATIYKYMAIQASGKDYDAAGVVSELEKAQKADGSFAESVHATSLAVRYLSEADLDSAISVSVFDTKLSTTAVSKDKSTNIKALTNISYVSPVNASLDMKLTVFNGDAVVYEKVTPVSLSANETSAEIESGEFKLSEPEDNGLYVLAELYRGDVLVKAQKINLSLEEGETVYSTEINKVTPVPDKRFIYVGEESPVDIAFDLLYATNIERDAVVKIIVTKDGKQVTSASNNVKLIPEKNILTADALSFSPDTSSEGKYEITSICEYNGKEVCRGTAEISVCSVPEIEENPDDSDEAKATQFEITWFGPIASDYYLYAGSEKEISAGAEINYYSNGTFSGKVDLTVSKGEDILAETSFDVSVPKGETTYFEGKAEFPVFKAEDQISFMAKNTGEYILSAKLYAEDGELIDEGSRTIYVVDKPVQDLVLRSSDDGDGTIDLSWNDISNDAESYSYQLYRNTNKEGWEARSIWNEEEHIRVLNVYPYQPFLVEWMNDTVSDGETPAGKGIFDIDPVHIATFNNDPATYLYNEDGSWKCDVIFFGTSDSNSNYDISQNAVIEVQKFIDSGRGVLFGHDTIGETGFNNFTEQAGLMIGAWNISRTTSASVVKIGTLTNYPWVIRGDLTIPNTHSTSQYIVDATEWITLNNYKYVYPDTGYKDGFYLCTKDNIGMIQTGDSTGQATDDERKVIANTLFYLYQISQQTTAKDASFYDIDAPDKPSELSSVLKDGKLELTVSSKDNPTEYEYYVSANPGSSDGESILSNVEKHTAFSDLAGFVVKVSSDPESDPSLLEYNEDRDKILGIIPANADGKAVLTAVPEDMSEQQYVHVFAVDNAGNVSEEYITPFAESGLNADIRTDKKLYAGGETVDVVAEALSAPFGRTADMKIEINDDSGYPRAELVAENDKALSAGQKLESETQWIIPSDATGKFTASVKWMKNGEVVAEAETPFRVANGETVSNTITSDKKKYASGEPVNLDSAVYNESTAASENDLVMKIKVTDASSNEVASFEHNIGMLSPGDSASYKDALTSVTLPDGKYTASAIVEQDGLELSSDSAEFEVEGSVSAFTGKLDLEPGDGKAKASFSVTNSGAENTDSVIVRVDVYKEGSDDKIYAYSETVSIGAGETVDLSGEFDLPADPNGRYSGVLSAEYRGSSSDLDYDGFDYAPAVTTITTTAATTAKTSPATTTTTVVPVNSPKTGDGKIPAYMWLISVISIAGLVVLKIMGGEENEEK